MMGIKKITKLVQEMQGTFLGVGIHDAFLLKTIENNSKIDESYLLNSGVYSNEKGKRTGKTINIHKIQNKFRKKSFDFILCSFEEVQPYLRTFLPNTIYLNRRFVYLYGSKNSIDLEELEKRYTRYGSIVHIEQQGDFFIMSIDNSNVKYSFLKKFIYRIRDFFYDMFEHISNFIIQ